MRLPWSFRNRPSAVSRDAPGSLTAASVDEVEVSTLLSRVPINADALYDTQPLVPPVASGDHNEDSDTVPELPPSRHQLKGIAEASSDTRSGSPSDFEEIVRLGCYHVNSASELSQI